MRVVCAAVRCLLIVSVLTTASVRLLGADDQPQNSAVAPASKLNEDWWKKRHEGFNERAKQGNVDLLLIGDSITHGWEGDGKSVWENFYTKRNAMNLGIGGDRTQHVLWRLDNGNIEGLKPKAAVLMIGTNNSNGNDNTAEEIGVGIQAVVKKLREKLPETKVLILAVFPRGDKPNPQREKNAKASQIAAELADNKNIYYLDIGPKFLQEDGTLAKEVMPDLLHLSPQGYEIWAASIEDRLADLMGEKK